MVLRMTRERYAELKPTLATLADVELESAGIDSTRERVAELEERLERWERLAEAGLYVDDTRNQEKTT